MLANHVMLGITYVGWKHAGLSEQQIEAMLEAQKPQEDPAINNEDEFPSLGMEPSQQLQHSVPKPVSQAAVQSKVGL